MIQCSIEGEQQIACLYHNDDVYVPFKGYLKQRFDLTGALNRFDKTTFELQQSYAKVGLSVMFVEKP